MIGTTIDRYKILEELGHGGMSVVYRATDTTLERDVAVKVLHSHLAKKLENRRRFHREAKAIARLRHPNILSIFDYSSEDAQRAFIVMEFVDGLNMREFIAMHGPPPVEMVALIGVEIANALSAAHDHGIIHRDLKPENIMISGDGELKLMDFGIAHVIDAETMTQTGSLLGSPGHMAPEMIEGERVGPLVDVFALGTVLYWLATGKLPFDGSNAPQVLKKVLEGNCEPPDVVEPRVGADFSRIILKCMSHDPGERFGSAREVRTVLEDFLDDGLAFEAPETDLPAYFTSPQRWTEVFLEDVEDRLVRRAEQALDENDIPRATDLFNRVLAYDPNDPRVHRFLERLHRKRIANRLALSTLFIALIGGIVFLIVSSTDPSHEPEPALEREVVDTAEVQAAVVEAQSRAAQISEAESMGKTLAMDVRRLAREFKPRAPAKVVNEIPRLTSPNTRVILNTSTPDAGMSPDAEAEVQTWLYRFRLAPAAAELSVNGQTLTSFEASQGIELPEGRYTLTARSKGCKTWRRGLVVDGPQNERMDVVLEWEAGLVRVLTDVDSVVYLGDDTRDIARRVSARKPATFRFDFGDADQESARPVVFRVAPARDMTRLQRHRVTVRPGNVENLNLSFQ